MQIQYNNQIIEFSDEFSQKILMIPFIDIPDGTFVYASCFYQENMPDSHIFRENMRGVTFYNCNLDNVFIPEGNELNECSHKNILIQNDLNDWIVDENEEPTLPVGHEVFTKFNLPMPDPEDIPDELVSKRINLLEIAKGSIQ